MHNGFHGLAISAKAALYKQQVTANNLANASTSGFVRDMNVATHEMITKGQVGPETVRYDMGRGDLIATGGVLDVAPQTDSFFAVLDSNGQEAYTRRGDLRIDESGQLINGSGQALVGSGGPIFIPEAESITIGVDGTVSIVPLGADVSSIAAVGQIKMVSPEGRDLDKGTDGLFRLVGGGAAPVDPEARLVNGYVEGSNVNVVNEMVDMIDASRNFELSMRMINSIHENDQHAAQILQIVS